MRMVYQISKHTVYLSIDTPQSIVYTIPRGAAYTKRQAVIAPRKRVMRMDSINATLVLLIVLFYLISHKQK